MRPLARGKKTHEKIIMRLHPLASTLDATEKVAHLGEQTSGDVRSLLVELRFFFSHCKLKSGRRSFLTGTVPEFERVLLRYSIASHEERVLRASFPFFFSLIPELEEILPNECSARTRLFRFCQLTGTLVHD